MRRLSSILLLALAAACGGLTPALAQTARDSAFAKTARQDLDSIARDRSAPQYSQRAQKRLRARIDSLLRPPAPTPPPLPAAPVASFVVVCGTNLACSFNAGASTGARLSYQWDCGALPNCTSTAPSFSFAYPHDGARTARLTVRDSLGRTASTSRTFTVPAPVVVEPPPVDSVVTPLPPPLPDTTITIAVAPELPRAVPDAALKPSVRTVRVAPPMDLQAAFNNAQPGDRLALSGEWVGNFILPAKSCAGGQWITVTSDAVTLPPVGTRIRPSAAAGFARILTDNNQPALRAASPTRCWQLDGFEVAVAPTFTGLQYHLVALGDGGWAAGGEVQTSLDRVPADLILRRMYIHGQPGSNLVRCVALNSARTAIVDSWIDACHAKGFDSQAIEGWNGPGPYLIENNYLAGAGENVMAGGADPGIPNLVPSDITIRRNHVVKPPAWKGVWTVKNLLELKNARRVLIEGNVFENNWVDAQVGMAIVIKSTTDTCGTRCMWEGTTDVTFRYNVVRNSPRGFNVQAYDDSYVPTGTDVHVQRVRAEHNLFENIGRFNGTGEDGWLLLLTHDLTDVAVVHNTFVGNLPNAGTAVVMDYGNGAARRLQIDDNVFAGQNYYAVFYSGTQVGTKSLQAMAGSSWTFQRNVVASVGAEYVPWHPTSSWYPATVAAIGLAADYSLGPTSPYRGKGWDGSDPGANIPELTRRTAGVVIAP